MKTIGAAIVVTLWCILVYAVIGGAFYFYETSKLDMAETVKICTPACHPYTVAAYKDGTCSCDMRTKKVRPPL